MDTTFPRLLLKHASERPNAPAMREKEYGIWQTLTWSALAVMAQGIAAGLHVRCGTEDCLWNQTRTEKASTVSQIEQLVHGRDRLLQSFERARIAAVDVISEMTPVGEPDEFVNLTPTTGPVPLMVPASAASMSTPVAEPEVEVEPGEAAQEGRPSPGFDLFHRMREYESVHTNHNRERKFFCQPESQDM